jgi:hypothetical protein
MSLRIANCFDVTLLFRYHAFSVFHFSYLFLRLTKVTESMSKVDVLAVMIASISHDLGTPLSMLEMT